MRIVLVVIILAALASALPVRAQDSDSDAELAKKLANPVAAMVSLPFQFNYDCCAGPKNADRVLLNVQPVIPFVLSSDWNLIVRTIVPVVDQPSPMPGGGTSFGLGDTTQSLFFSPRPSGNGFIWAVGPDFLWPTATDAALGNHKWGAGPTLLMLEQQGGWTYGLLLNHIWSYGGEGEYPNVSNSFLQPFVGYTWSDTTSVNFNMEDAYSWTSKQWTAPFNLSLGHLFNFGGQRTSLQLGARYYAVRPDGGSTWGLRFSIVFLLPK